MFRFAQHDNLDVLIEQRNGCQSYAILNETSVPDFRTLEERTTRGAHRNTYSVTIAFVEYERRVHHSPVSRH